MPFKDVLTHMESDAYEIWKVLTPLSRGLLRRSGVCADHTPRQLGWLALR
jgi:hypothetical protein